MALLTVCGGLPSEYISLGSELCGPAVFVAYCVANFLLLLPLPGNRIAFKSSREQFFTPIANVLGRTNIAFSFDENARVVLAASSDHTKVCLASKHPVRCWDQNDSS
jgi:hypothetical protein